MTSWMPTRPEPVAAGGARPRDLILIAVLALLVPLGLRPLAARVLAEAEPSYLPALETLRTRRPYDPTFRDDLRNLRPSYIFIGDSMLGSRIDPAHMRRVIKQPTWWVMQPGTGSAYWYLAFKNHVLGAGLKPKVVFFFFRDYNLTNLMFRLEDGFRWSVDTVAGPEEPELDEAIARRITGPWHAVHRAVEGFYGSAPVAAVADAALRDEAVRWQVGARRQERFQKQLNDLFGLDRLRPLEAADMAAAEAQLADFDRNLPRSILPEIIALGREHRIRLVFVRVQRRPRPDGPPEQTPALEQYIRDLRAYLEANGAVFHDDTGDPDYTLDWYKDGDHTGGWTRRSYTELFARKLAAVFE